MQAALLSAVSEILSIEMAKKYGTFLSKVMANGKPPVHAPRLFAAVHDAGCIPEDGIDYGFKCECMFEVTVSCREVTLPPDKAKDRILDLTKGWEKIRFDIIDAIHMNYSLCSLADTKLTDYGLTGTFSTGDAPLVKGVMAPPEPESPDWWWANGEGFAGYSFSVGFGNIRFMRSGKEMRQ